MKKNCKNEDFGMRMVIISEILPIFAVENDSEVRLHLGNEQARCSRFALTLLPQMRAKVL